MATCQGKSPNPWIALNEPHFDHEFMDPLRLNPGEIILASECKRDDNFMIGGKLRPGIFKYDTVTQKSALFIPYADSEDEYDDIGVTLAYHTMPLDKSNRILYIFDGTARVLLIIDLMTKSKKWHYDILASEEQWTVNAFTGAYPASLVIDGVLHVFGGKQWSTHLIWNHQQKQFDSMHNFQEGLCDFEVVHIASKQSLYIFGGVKGGWIGEASADIHVYSIPNRKWTTLEIKLPEPIPYAPAIWMEEEQRVILIDSNGGWIYAVDVDTMQFQRATIKMVSNQNCYAVLNSTKKRDNHIVFGYIRQFKAVLIPKEIQDLLFKWFSDDYIFVFECERSISPKWKICVRDIFDNLA